MLREQIKRICLECGLTQKGLADVIGVRHQRVRDMAAGRVEKLTREEGEALIRKLHVRAEWLATGQPPMLQSDQERRAEEVLGKVGNAAQAASSLGLDMETGRRVSEFLFYVSAGNADAARKALAEMTGLSPDEEVLLDRYRRLPKKAQETLLATSGLIVGEPLKPKKSKKITVTANGGHAAGRDIVTTKKVTKRG